MQAISSAGLTITAGDTEDALQVHPVENITPGLADEIKAHKVDIIKVLREDTEMERTGIIQAERQVFELAREYFGSKAIEEKNGVV